MECGHCVTSILHIGLDFIIGSRILFFRYKLFDYYIIHKNYNVEKTEIRSIIPLKTSTNKHSLFCGHDISSNESCFTVLTKALMLIIILLLISATSSLIFWEMKSYFYYMVMVMIFIIYHKMSPSNKLYDIE